VILTDKKTKGELLFHYSRIIEFPTTVLGNEHLEHRQARRGQLESGKGLIFAPNACCKLNARDIEMVMVTEKLCLHWLLKDLTSL
jgi:hypothetical protein